jgi:hypothetical protein
MCTPFVESIVRPEADARTRNLPCNICPTPLLQMSRLVMNAAVPLIALVLAASPLQARGAAEPQLPSAAPAQAQAAASTPAPAQATPQAQPSNTPADQAPPFTLDGVRRAATLADQPSPDRPPPDPAQPAKPITKSAARQQIDVATWAPEPTFRPPHDDRTFTTSLAPNGPAWHQEFLAMTTPELYSPFAYMGNAERLEAVASSMAFAYVVNGLTRLVQALVHEQKSHKVEKVRREIDEETKLVEQRHKAWLTEQQQATPSSQPIRKRP